jgi:hypothetical protein
MSSLARRTLRTTVAATGVAALGVGLAGTALAAPAPAADAVDDTAPPAGPTSAVGDVLPAVAPLAELTAAAPAAPALPMLFVFEAPTVYAAGPGEAVPGTAALDGSDAFADPTAATPRQLHEAVHDRGVGGGPEAGERDDADGGGFALFRGAAHREVEPGTTIFNGGDVDPATVLGTVTGRSIVDHAGLGW